MNTRNAIVKERTAPLATARPRYAFLDVARGGALLLMFVYHFSWDLTFFQMADFQIFTNWRWMWFAKFIASIILFVMGIAQVMARRRQEAKRDDGDNLHSAAFLRRLGLIVGAAALVSAATFIVDDHTYIFFGILHHIAAASVILFLIQRLPSAAIAVLAVLVALAPTFLRFDLFNANYLLWLGLSTALPISVDYVPLFPWLAVPLAGVLAGHLLFRRDVPAALAWTPANPVLRTVRFRGRHSLIVYLVHQPILYGGLYAFVWLRAYLG